MLKVTAPLRIDLSAGGPDSFRYRNESTGYVLNVAIDRYVYATLGEGELKVSTNGTPSCSGLGSSAALGACLIAAVNPSLAEDKDGLIWRVSNLENQSFGKAAGLQDQAASIYGSLNLWRFKGDRIERTPINPQGLESRLVLVYTGEKHSSAALHKGAYDVLYEKNRPRLKELSGIALAMSQCLDDPVLFASLMDASWEIKRELAPGIETEKMRLLQSELQGLYSACKATGAGGGGCMVFFTYDKNRLAEAVSRLEIPEIKLLPFGFDHCGIRIEQKENYL